MPASRRQASRKLAIAYPLSGSNLTRYNEGVCALSMDKPPSEWTEQDLLSLIQSGAEEQTDLEYKRGDALTSNVKAKNEISKDVSALANGAGGVIVYGMVEEQHTPRQLDGVDPAQVTKEWLEQVINGRVRPRLAGVYINLVALTASAPGKVAYVVSVPQAPTAHQAADKRYYKRFNFESVPMEDYEIRDIMNRMKHPLIIPSFSRRFIDRKATVCEYALNISLVNKGAVSTHDVKAVFTVPRTVSKVVKGFDKQRIIEIPSRLFGNQWFENPLTAVGRVIFPEDDWELTNGKDRDFVLIVDTSRIDMNETREPILLWKTYADDMPPQSGQVMLGEIPSVGGQ
ncbi:AlbA_2 domain-containing protein [Nitrospira tepida]|uniref:AlbA_2 domain-containing protein n=2 Tax=Nitrospira TaxID=1234 RepID=A0AA86MZ24_9BACT|nr:AlbA_2 domain-containing protein [Nitrospira tepida]